MTQYEGIRTASDAQLGEGILRLGEEIEASPVGSPTWKAAVYWRSCAEAEKERRPKPVAVIDEDFDDDVPVMDRGLLWGLRDDRPLTRFFSNRDMGDEA